MLLRDVSYNITVNQIFKHTLQHS